MNNNIDLKFKERYSNNYWDIKERYITDDLDEEKEKRKNFFIKTIGKDYTDTFEKYWEMYWPIQYPWWYVRDWKWWNTVKEALYQLCLLYWVDPLKVMVKEKYGRFDISSWDNPEWFCDAIWELEGRSMTICQKCGKRWKNRYLPWVMTLCWKHYMKELISRKYVRLVWKIKKFLNFNK